MAYCAVERDAAGEAGLLEVLCNYQIGIIS